MLWLSLSQSALREGQGTLGAGAALGTSRAVTLPSELPDPLFTEFKAKYMGPALKRACTAQARPSPQQNNMVEVVHALNFALLWRGPLYVYLTCAPEQSDRKTILVLPMVGPLCFPTWFV